ncbi:MAG TPA: glycosyltransferase family 9 protein, partial [Ktedonobacteraceae bacterium]|nr:glycosyltransferase family 9 protein [Ktedonobacteraceae bacterium]
MKRVLVIRPGALGDALLTFPVIQALRRRYAAEKSELEVMLVSHPAIRELARTWGVAQRTDDYSAVIWSELFSSTGIRSPRLREELAQIDLAICWLRDSEGLIERNLRMAGCRQVVIAPGRPAEEAHEHIVRYLGQTLGLEVDARAQFTLASGLTPYQQEQNEGRRVVAIHPGSGGARKCWPLEKFAEVIDELRRREIPVLLLSGPAEQERFEALSRILGQVKGLRMLENAPLLEVCQELQQCCCYLGNDAGMTHLAALLGMPTLVLFGPSDPRMWRPVGEWVRVLREMEGLGVEVVME